MRYFGIRNVDNLQHICYNLGIEKDIFERLNTMNNKDFGDRLKELRTRKNLSQKKLGEMIGVHFSHIGRYERGVCRPTSDFLKRLAEALGVTADYLIEGSTDTVARSKIEDRELLQQFQEVEKFPNEDKILVKKFIEAFIKKIQMEKVMNR